MSGIATSGIRTAAGVYKTFVTHNVTTKSPVYLMLSNGFGSFY
jgi:hypothetical protein